MFGLASVVELTSGGRILLGMPLKNSEKTKEHFKEAAERDKKKTNMFDPCVRSNALQITWIVIITWHQKLVLIITF